MARIKLILGVLAVVVASFVALSGPAMAQDLNCKDARGDWIRCDGTYYAPVDNSWGNNDWWNNDWQDAYNTFQQNCIGVTSGGDCIGVGPDLDYYTDGSYYWYD
jgi:hypothetical protein